MASTQPETPSEAADVTTPAKTDAAPAAAPVEAPSPAPTLPTLSATTPVEEPKKEDGATFLRETRGTGWDFSPPDEDTQRKIQQILSGKGLYDSRINGKWGGLTVAALEVSVGLRPTQEPSSELCQAILEATDHTRRKTARLDQGVWDEFATYLEAN